jgi:hypothetical protein
MNDYLDNLIVRTLQLAPVVRPRLPSLFEPSSAADNHSSAAAEHAVNASSANEIISEGQTSASPIQESSEPQPFVEAPAQPSKAVAFEIGNQTATPETRAVSPLEKSDTFEKPDSSQKPISRRDEYMTPAAQQVLTPTPLETKPTETRLIRELVTKTAQPSNPQSSAADSPAGENEVYKLSRSPAKVVEGSPAERMKPERGEVVEATALRAEASRVVQAARRQEDARLFPTHDEVVPFRAPEPPQTISVTIGRVDVRAVFPQQPAQPPRRERPARPMSLDEYLKQQSEGRQ